MKTVFLSSTFRDLATHREAAVNAIERLDGYHCVRMETFGARAWDADEFCRHKVAECDLFVAIIGHLHGSTVPGSNESYTEREYAAAVMNKKPILAFLAHEDFPLPASLRQSEEQWERQKQFRERSKRAWICKTFSTPEDLEREVPVAIANWNREDGVATRDVGRGHEDPPKLGSLVPKLCNRQAQENEFTHFFFEMRRQRPRSPQIFVLRGAESECHESLVERLCHTTVMPVTEQPATDGSVGTALRSVAWPCDGSLEERIRDLQISLFRECDPTRRSLMQALTVDSFVEACRRLQRAIIVVQHGIAAECWDRHTSNLIRWYLEFWEEVGALDTMPGFVVFLNVVYPSSASARGRDRLRRRTDDALRRVLRLRKEPRRCGVVLLKELEAVKPHDVRDWFKRHNILEDPIERQQRLQRLFEAEGHVADSLPMMYVESALNKIVREYSQQRSHV